MADNEHVVLSGVEGQLFPAIPGSMGSRLLSVLYQLEQSQWWGPERLQQQQLAQLDLLLRHAYQHVPFHRQRLHASGYRPGMTISAASYARLARLTRSEVQQLGAQLHSAYLPQSHGNAVEVQSSGSTGRPIKALGSDLTQFFWQAMSLRDHLWHRRDLSLTLAAIRPDRSEAGQVVTLADWGRPVNAVFKSGQSLGLNSRVDIAQQWAWLQTVQPGYLLTMPSNLAALLRYGQRSGGRLKGLREVRTFGETVTPDLRNGVREVLGVGLTDMYSTQEVGYLALQCPECEQYHVQAETMWLEVLDDDGQPCAPGEIGRVVVTPLQNFAMPLLRYEVGDYAEVGDNCGCGRGLPVLRRIVGRSRNMVQTPDGKRYWPSFPAEDWMDIGAIKQIQLVQHSLHMIEVRVAMQGNLTSDLEQALQAVLQRSLGYPFALKFTYMDAIPVQANGKYEDFISLLDAT